jgi:hypothetical protein
MVDADNELLEEKTMDIRPTSSAVNSAWSLTLYLCLLRHSVIRESLLVSNIKEVKQRIILREEEKHRTDTKPCEWWYIASQSRSCSIHSWYKLLLTTTYMFISTIYSGNSSSYMSATTTVSSISSFSTSVLPMYSTDNWVKCQIPPCNFKIHQIPPYNFKIGKYPMKL